MIMNYYRVLDKKKYQFDFLINRRERGAYEEEIEKLGGMIFRMTNLSPLKYWRYKRELKDFLAAHPEYKIMHSHLEERSWWALNVAKAAGVKVRIAHMHNAYPLEFTPKSLYRQWLRWRMRWSRTAITERLACSQLAGKWLYGRKTFQVVANAINLEQFVFDAAKRKKTRASLGLDDDCVLIGQFGRITHQKNPLMMPKVLRELGGKYRLMYVGKGEMEGELKSEVEKLGVEKRVLMVEPTGKIEDYYAAIDVLVQPSWHEGLSLVVIEAAASGLMVLESDRVTKEVDVAERVAFLDIADLDLWQKAVKKIEVQTSRARTRASERAVELIREHGYDVKCAVKWLEDYYKEVL